MKLSLIVPATEAVHTFHSQGDLVVFGEGENEVSIHGTPDELRRFADKVIAAADVNERLAQVQGIAHLAGIETVTSS